MCHDDGLPADVKAYLMTVVQTLQSIFTSSLRSVFLIGSASYAQYEPGISDLDILAVISDFEEKADKLQEVTRRMSHSVVPCPATRLELVVYTRSEARVEHRRPNWCLNFNTGGYMDGADLVQLQMRTSDSDERGAESVSGSESESDERWWYLLNIASARELGRTLYGTRNTAQAFAAPSRNVILDDMRDCIRWFALNQPHDPSAVLNACRAWRWTAVSMWGSKKQGAEWVLRQRRPTRRRGGAVQPHHEYEDVIKMALEHRTRRLEWPECWNTIDHERTLRFFFHVVDIISNELAAEPCSAQH